MKILIGKNIITRIKNSVKLSVMYFVYAVSLLQKCMSKLSRENF